MRCVECQTETDTPHKHCECCGRELVAAAAPVASSSAAETQPAVKLCAVCGGPSPEGDCCTNCLNSFSGWGGTEHVAAPPPQPPAPPPAEKKDIDRLWAELMNTPPPPSSEFVAPAASATPVAPIPVAPTPAAPRSPAVAVSEPPKMAAPLSPQPAPPQLARPPQLDPPPQLVPSTPPTLLPATTVTPAPRSTMGEGGSTRTDGVHLEAARTEPVRKKTPKAAPVANDWRPKNVPKPPKPINQLLLPMAALVVVAVGLGGYWVRVHGGLSAVLEGQTAEAGAKPERAPQSASASRAAESVKAAPAEKSARPAPQPEKPKPSQPKPAARPAATAKARPASAPAPAHAPIPAAPVAVPVVFTVAPEAPAAPASPAPSTLPQGPFFEPTDVQEAPRVARRVEPDVPEELRARASKEIVIVRMLVSQIGRPSRVTLLRKSKSGPRVDDAVIAAVNQWTFSPAKRRGEAVSSWFNIGVPVMAN